MLGSNLYGRIIRALKQRMFVVSRELNKDNFTEEFNVLGSVGNSYKVTVNNQIKCSCMDYALRRGHCKHILMILLKVYHLPFEHPWYKSLKSSMDQRSEALVCYAKTVDPSVLVPADIREKILSICNGQSSSSAANAQRRPLDTSDCPICFEEFEEPAEPTIEFCKVCGNNIHKECLQQWLQAKKYDATCVYCRAPWVDSAVMGKKNLAYRMDSAHIHEGYYANFAGELGISKKRDTSLYGDNI
ncbi:hypothetical protein BDB01DRAFT_816447 [Pilobolus umbonatus]|nr:hypothetical protein BDB01DRAFT_816447 [Pilobolus umbonatus]